MTVGRTRGGTAHFAQLRPLSRSGQRIFYYLREGDFLETVKVEYFGHACFRLSWGGQRIVLDPYADGSVPGYGKLRLDADFVYCSHGHGDHNAVEAVKLSGAAEPKFGLTELLTDHDDAGGSKRGKSMIRVFDFGGVRVAHFGDLGRELTEKEYAALDKLDCALIPVGGFFTIDAETAASITAKLRPRLTIPMHYRTEKTGYEVLADIDDALLAFDEEQNVIPLTYGGYAVIEQ